MIVMIITMILLKNDVNKTTITMNILNNMTLNIICTLQIIEQTYTHVQRMITNSTYI